VPPSGPFRVLRVGTFSLFFLAQVGSDIGSALATVGFAFAVLDLRVRPPASHW
jgi:hypothetical protein